MKNVSRFLIGSICCLAAVVFVISWNNGRGGPAAAKSAETQTKTPHKKTTPHIDETRLNIVELSPESVEHLGLKVTELSMQSMTRFRPYGAEIVLPTDAAVVVSAPLPATINPAKEGHFPKVGQSVSKNEPLLELLPLLTPERSVLTPAERIRVAEAKLAVAQAQIDADGQYQQALVQVEAAKVALARAERLYKSSVGTKQAVDDANAQQEMAQKSLTAAKSRKELVDNIKLEEQAGTLQPITIDAPLSGIIRAANVQPGQLISTGAALFEVMDDHLMWVKVPVYVGDLQELDPQRSARLTLLDGRQSDRDAIAEPIDLPPTALPLSAAVDLYYEVKNPNGQFRPGQKVAAHLPLSGQTDVKSVPWSAVVYDIYGGQWVYEQVAPGQYARQRVEVGWIDNGQAALRHGPAVGSQIVTAGAAELMGTEFGFAK